MNRLLQIPEILRLICDQVPSDEKLGRYRLFVTALSCRALLEPALDSLWYSIHSFMPIVACCPDGLWSKQEDAFGFYGEPYTFIVGPPFPLNLLAIAHRD